MVCSWPIKNVNIYLLLNVHTEQIIKITHTSQASFSLVILGYFIKTETYLLPSLIHHFLILLFLLLLFFFYFIFNFMI